MTKLEQVFRPIIQINSFTKQKVKRVEVPVPEVGLRWGATARLQYTTDRKDLEDNKPSVTVQRNKERFLIGHEIGREFEKVELLSNLGRKFNTESIKSLTFFCHRKEHFEWEQKNETIGNVQSLEEVKVITDVHVRFSFPPNVLILSKGDRGEPQPEPTPTEDALNSKLDARYSGGTWGD